MKWSSFIFWDCQAAGENDGFIRLNCDMKSQILSYYCSLNFSLSLKQFSQLPLTIKAPPAKPVTVITVRIEESRMWNLSVQIHVLGGFGQNETTYRAGEVWSLNNIKQEDMGPFSSSQNAGRVLSRSGEIGGLYPDRSQVHLSQEEFCFHVSIMFVVWVPVCMCGYTCGVGAGTCVWRPKVSPLITLPYISRQNLSLSQQHAISAGIASQFAPGITS